MNIYQGDFIENRLNKNYFHKIIANPPFSKNQDVKHILKMYELLEK
jgi:16S rRNA G1207 methylase RsmC